MIDDPEHPRMKQAQRRLEAKVRRFVGRPLTGNTVRQVLDLIDDHRRECRWIHGVLFPELRPLVCQRDGTISLHRADLDPRGIATVIRNYVIQHPDLEPTEIAAAVRVAWPDYRPARAADEVELNRARMARSLVRQGVENLPRALAPVAEREA